MPQSLFVVAHRFPAVPPPPPLLPRLLGQPLMLFYELILISGNPRRGDPRRCSGGDYLLPRPVSARLRHSPLRSATRTSSAWTSGVPSAKGFCRVMGHFCSPWNARGVVPFLSQKKKTQKNPIPYISSRHWPPRIKDMGTRGLVGDKWSQRILWFCAIGSAISMYMVAVERQAQNRERALTKSLRNAGASNQTAGEEV